MDYELYDNGFADAWNGKMYIEYDNLDVQYIMKNNEE